MQRDAFFEALIDGSELRARGEPHMQRGRPIPVGGHGKSTGVFAGWRWDGSQLTAKTDRSGFLPVYYACSDRAIRISTSVVRLLEEGVSPRLDVGALSVFLRYGNLVGEDTPFEDIRVLPPAADLRWRPGRLDLSGTYGRVDPRELSRQEQIDGFISLFRQAITRRAQEGEPFVVPLSGGKDSRLIVLELARQGFSPSLCLTARHPPPRPNQDLWIAERLSARLGVPHTAVDQPPDRVGTELEKNLRTDFCSDEHGWLLALDEWMDSSYASMYDGIGGDVLSDVAGDGTCARRVSELLEAGDLDAAARELVRLPDRTIRRMVHPDIYQGMEAEAAHARIVEELGKHVGAPNPVASYYFWNRTRRKIGLAPFRLFRGVRHVHAPFLDSDVVGFLASLSWRSVADGGLREGALAAAFPAFADLPFESALSWDYSSTSAKRHYRRFAAGILRYARTASSAGTSLVHPWFVDTALRVGRVFGGAAGRYGWLYTRLLYLYQLGSVLNRSRSHWISDHGGSVD